MTVDDAVKVLEDYVLARMFDHTLEPGWGFSLRFFEPELHREVVRGVLRKLRADGKVDFYAGLWTEDGEMAGSGYFLDYNLFFEMREAEAHVRAMEMEGV